MAQKVEDFNLPLTAITRIVQGAIPEGVKVTDGAKTTLAKAASVFVLYATSSANSLSHDDNRKRILAKDVFEALKDLDLDFLVPPLHNALTAYHDSLETKKQEKESKRASNSAQETSIDDDIDKIRGKPTDSQVDVIVLDSGSESASEEDNDIMEIESVSD